MCILAVKAELYLVSSSIQSIDPNILYISSLIPFTISKAFFLAFSSKYRLTYNDPMANEKLPELISTHSFHLGSLSVLPDSSVLYSNCLFLISSVR